MVRVAVISLLALSLSVSVASAAEFLGTPRCGDCWCINGDETCPTDTVGIIDSFSEADAIFSTFELTNSPPFLNLKDAAGGDCYPFKDNMGVIEAIPESSLAQCVRPEETEDTVCAYVYDSSSTTCDGRKYTIQNFASDNDAMAANAHIVHKGGCGVCSSAQDLGARIKNSGSLEKESIKCAISYTFTSDMEKLVGCYTDLGFTQSCSALWAYFVAVNGRTCAGVCLPDATGTTKLIEEPPLCLPSACLQCQLDFRKDFDDIAGIEFKNAGITEAIAYSCDSFYRVIHDPCIGLDGPKPPILPPPVPGDEPPLGPPEGEESESTEESSATKSTNLFVIAASLALAFVSV